MENARSPVYSPISTPAQNTFPVASRTISFTDAVIGERTDAVRQFAQHLLVQQIVFGTLKREAGHRASHLVADIFEGLRRAARRFGKCFHGLDSVGHEGSDLMLARRGLTEREACVRLELRVNR